jgi:hypothetical protein
MLERTVYIGFCWGNPSERDHLEDPGVDWKIILRWIFKKWDVEEWTGSSWLRIGTGRHASSHKTSCKTNERMLPHNHI